MVRTLWVLFTKLKPLGVRDHKDTISRVLFGKGAWGRSGSKLVSLVSLLPNLGGSDVSGGGWRRRASTQRRRLQSSLTIKKASR